MDPKQISTNGFEKHYSEQSFWEKIKDYAKKAGVELIRNALEAYYVSRSQNVPTWIKAMIIAALGYFISPIDVIPDVTPIVGYTDDLAVLVLLIKNLAEYISPEIRARVEEKLQEFFGK